MRFPFWAPSGVRCALAFAIAAATPCAVFAVEPPRAAATAPSSSPAATGAIAAELQRAVLSLWAVNPQVAAARADYEAARAHAVAASRPLYNPSLELGGENADVRRRTIGLSLPLDLAGKRAARDSVAAADLRAAEAAYDGARRDIAARWLKAWFASQVAEQETALGERRLRLMRRFDELAGKRLRTGDVSSPERDLAALALAEAQIQQASLLGQSAADRAALQALGPITAAPVALSQVEPPGVAPTSGTSIDDLPELRGARLRADSAYAEVTVAQRNRIPDPVLSLNGGQVNISPSGAAPNGRSHFNVVGVSLSIPLPIRNSYAAQVRAARADADAAAAHVGVQRLAAQARLDESLARYAALRDAGESFRHSRAAAFDERADLLERLWNAGEITTADYLLQLKQSLDTALSGVRLRGETWQAFIDYQVAADRLLGWVDAAAAHGHDKEYAR